ncbi:macrophage mannose receptor 1-like [Sander lucioperca]|uniref:macrophage mannose receptor 1-like n=1 Tax=Sander lucioperca TaxID=283035 RepID=UPI00125CE8DC|nr:macrophage mannose receptor 1-like [Sander lucioperca]
MYYPATNWVNSQELCRSRHTDLAYVSTKAENSNIANVAGMFNGLWIGLFSDVWMWSDGRETSFRYWLSGSPDLGDCASVAVSQQGRWIGADCNQKAVFACQGGLKLKRMVIRITMHSKVDLTNSVGDALLKKLETSLRQKMTDFNLSWQSDKSGLIFQRQEQLEATKKPGC